MPANARGLIFNIQRYSLHDGPGVRTTVFMKGCPLRCLWCANPESINPYPELAYSKTRCIKCYRCLEICPNGAITVEKEGDFIAINRTICEDCSEHRCLEVCYQGALEWIGKNIAADELLRDVRRDGLLYRISKGGVTISGGEPVIQADFTLKFLKMCREKGIHTVLDTCGHAEWKIFKNILPYVDVVLYDIKHMDPLKHKELTGASNKLILENARAISSFAGIHLMLRLPIIPGCNDSEINFRDVAEFMKEIGAKEITLLPYHRLGREKYNKLDKEYKLDEILPPTDRRLSRIKDFFALYDISCLFY